MDIIVDVDGTVANLDHRLGYVKSKPKNWPAFFKGVKDDAPIPQVIEVIRTLYGEHRIVFLSGRSEECRKDTEQWTKDHVRIGAALYMRKSGDYRADDIIKLELLDQVRKDGYNPTIVFDDRPRVVKAWRKAGLFVFDVGQGKGDF